MLIKKREPKSSKYIYVNNATNRMHLLVPYIAGNEISAELHQPHVRLKKFFEEDARDELLNYKIALEVDMLLIDKDHPHFSEKKERLEQIEKYLVAIEAMRNHYGYSMKHFLTTSSNLYYFKLKTEVPTSYSEVANPVFCINLKDDKEGHSLSTFYTHMHQIFSKIIFTPKQLNDLVDSVLKALPENAEFLNIKDQMAVYCKSQMINVDFDYCIEKNSDAISVKQTVSKEYVAKYLQKAFGIKGGATNKEYINALWNLCFQPPTTEIADSFFCNQISLNEITIVSNLSKLTQFFLAHVNWYCVVHDISKRNFGEILDNNADLSLELVSLISKTLIGGNDVEQQICLFFNKYSTTFELTRHLDSNSISVIQNKFEKNYLEISLKDEDSQKNEFIILGTAFREDQNKFLSYQGVICTNFANIVNNEIPGQEYFSAIRKDFARVRINVKTDDVARHSYDDVTDYYVVDMEEVIKKLNFKTWDKLPCDIKSLLEQSPGIKKFKFLHYVSHGSKNLVSFMLQNSKELQELISTPGSFTDCSGKTFFCTAYEYAYWAKDIDTCRKLELNMDKKTKIKMIKLVDKIKQEGLTFWQHGKRIPQSKNFSFSRLINSLKAYISNNAASKNWNAITDDLAEIANAQRDVPAHILQEYNRNVCLFWPTKPLTVKRVEVAINSSHFSDIILPPDTENNSISCSDHILLRGDGDKARWVSPITQNLNKLQKILEIDLKAVIKFDTQKTQELGRLYDELKLSRDIQFDYRTEDSQEVNERLSYSYTEGFSYQDDSQEEISTKISQLITDTHDKVDMHLKRHFDKVKSLLSQYSPDSASLKEAIFKSDEFCQYCKIPREGDKLRRMEAISQFIQNNHKSYMEDSYASNMP